MTSTRINKKAGYLVEFINGSFEIIKRYTIDTSMVNMKSSVDVDMEGNETPILVPETQKLNNDYLSYIDQGDSGSIAPMINIKRIKAVKYKKIGDKTHIYTLDNKEFMTLG